MTCAFLFGLPMVPYLGVWATRSPWTSTWTSPAILPLLPRPCTLSDEAPESPSGPPFSQRRIRALARGWPWRRMDIPDWKELVSVHAILQGDVGIDDLRKVAVYLETFRDAAQRLLGGALEGRPLRARLYRSRTDYLRYAHALGGGYSESLYDPRNREIVACLEDGHEELRLVRILAHEYAHAWMDRALDRREPLWLAEGVAEYFSNFTVAEGRLVPGAADRRALLLLEVDPPEPLADFLRLGRQEMYGIRYAHRYAQAWSFVHYLFTSKPEVADLLLRGGAPPELAALEGGWREHLRRLRGAP